MGILLLKQLQSKDDAPGFASAALMASNGPAIHPGVPWYIRSGQWHADLRTLTELLRYLEDSGEFVQTNPIPAKADNA